MNVTRFSEALTYFPSDHLDMRCYRLQGGKGEPGSVTRLNLCHFLPGGSTGTSVSPAEKIYLVLEGELVVSNDGEETVLGEWDSCRIAPGEARLIENRTRRPASLLLAMTEGVAAPAAAQDSLNGNTV